MDHAFEISCMQTLRHSRNRCECLPERIQGIIAERYGELLVPTPQVSFHVLLSSLHVPASQSLIDFNMFRIGTGCILMGLILGGSQGCARRQIAKNSRQELIAEASGQTNMKIPQKVGSQRQVIVFQGFFLDLQMMRDDREIFPIGVGGLTENAGLYGETCVKCFPRLLSIGFCQKPTPPRADDDDAARLKPDHCLADDRATATEQVSKLLLAKSATACQFFSQNGFKDAFADFAGRRHGELDQSVLSGIHESLRMRDSLSFCNRTGGWMDPLWKMDAHDLVRGYDEGLFTPMEALDSVLDRAEAVEPVINAFVHIDARQARADAERSWNRWRQNEPRGPLDGVPVSIKDNLHVAGMPTTWGSRLMQGYVAGADERPVARLRRAGAVIFGKTNLPEFAMQGYTSNLIRGTTANPYDPTLTPGGSSGGAAAAVAAGVGPIALATDGGGSVRRPASYCNLIGLKPSRGAVERAGGLPDIFLDYEVVGPLSRSTADAISLFDALTGRTIEPQADRQLHILYVPKFGVSSVDPRISVSVAQAASRLAAMGHKIEEAAEFDLADDINALWTSLSTTALAWLFSNGRLWPELGGREIDLGLCSQNTRNVLSNAETVNAQTIYCLSRSIRDAENKLSALFLDYDVILTPTTAALAWPTDRPFPEVIDGHSVGPRGHAVFSAIANATGLPAISVPVDMAERIGFQMLAPHGADRLLLGLADQYRRRWGRDAFRFPDLGQFEKTA